MSDGERSACAELDDTDGGLGCSPEQSLSTPLDVPQPSISSSVSLLGSKAGPDRLSAAARANSPSEVDLDRRLRHSPTVAVDGVDFSDSGVLMTTGFRKVRQNRFHTISSFAPQIHHPPLKSPRVDAGDASHDAGDASHDADAAEEVQRPSSIRISIRKSTPRIGTLFTAPLGGSASSDEEDALQGGFSRAAPRGSKGPGGYSALPASEAAADDPDGDDEGAGPTARSTAKPRPGSDERCRRRVRKMLDDPSSSQAAAILQSVLLVFILASVLCATVETMPTMRQHSVFLVSEPAFTLVFSAEILARAWSCRSWWDFVGSPFNIVDVLTTLPGYMDLAFLSYLQSNTKKQEQDFERVEGSMWTLRVVRVVRMIRLLRVLRLAKAEAITVVLESLWHSLSGLYVLVSFVFLGSIISATGAYLAEVDVKGTAFVSIPAAFWYSASTVMATGYGDIVPHTMCGKMVGICTMFAGIMILAVCIAVITTSFIETYNRNLYMSRMRRLQRQAAAARQGRKGKVGPNNPSSSSEATPRVQPLQKPLLSATRRKRPLQLLVLRDQELHGTPQADIDLAACVTELERLTQLLVLRFEAVADRDVAGPTLAQLDASSGHRVRRAAVQRHVEMLRDRNKLWFDQLRGLSEELFLGASGGTATRSEIAAYT